MAYLSERRRDKHSNATREKCNAQTGRDVLRVGRTVCVRKKSKLKETRIWLGREKGPVHTQVEGDPRT